MSGYTGIYRSRHSRRAATPPRLAIPAVTEGVGFRRRPRSGVCGCGQRATQRWGDCRPRRAGRRQIRRPPLLLTRTGRRTPSSTVARRGRSPGDKHVEAGYRQAWHGRRRQAGRFTSRRSTTYCGAGLAEFRDPASSARRIAGGGIPCRQHDHIAGATAEKERRCLISARRRPRSTRPGCIPVPARDRCPGRRRCGLGMRWPCSWELYAVGYSSVLSELHGQSCQGGASIAMASAARTRMWRGRRRRRRRLSKLLARLGRRRPPMRRRSSAGVAPRGGRGQPHPVGDAGRQANLLRAEHDGDRGHRGRLRRDVGRGCRCHVLGLMPTSSSAAPGLTPFTEPPPTTNAGGQSDQAAGVAHDRRHLNRWTYSDNPVRAGADRVATAANPCDSRIFGLVDPVGVHLSGVVGTHRIPVTSILLPGRRIWPQPSVVLLRRG